MDFLTHVINWVKAGLTAWDLLPNFSSASGVFCLLVWISTLLALGLFVVSLFADVFGGDADVSGDIDGDAGHFSARAVIGFMLGFSWAGFVGIQSGLSILGAVGIGLLAGIVMFLIIMQLMRFIYSLRSDGNLDYDSLVGMRGSVYVTLPPHGQPGGQVQVSHPGQLITMAAIQHGDKALPAQTRIVVVEASTSLLVVRSLDDEQPAPQHPAGGSA